jgi:hypothetical protein
MKKVEINDDIVRYVPQSYDEITFEKYCELFFNLKDNPENSQGIDIENEVTIFSRLLDVEEEILLNSDIDYFHSFRRLFSFIYERESFFLKNVDNEIVLDNVTYHIPSNEDITLRQHIDLDITNNEKDSPTKLIEILAIALVEPGKKYTGEEKERTAMIEKLKNIPSTQAFRLLGFFLIKEKLSKKIIEISTYLQEEMQKLPPLTEISVRTLTGNTSSQA